MSALFDQDADAIRHLDFAVDVPCVRCDRLALFEVTCRGCEQFFGTFCRADFARWRARYMAYTRRGGLVRCPVCTERSTDFDRFIRTVTVNR